MFSESGQGWWNSGIGPIRAEGENRPSRPSTVTLCGPLGGGNDGIGRRSEDDPNLVYDTTQITSAMNRSNPQPGDPCHPLASTGHPPLLAHALTASRTRTGRPDPNGETFVACVAPPLPASAGTSRTGNARTDAEFLVRRLTPLECERLQGFPDGWTCVCGCEPYSTAACRCKDGPRYRVLGNAVTVPVIEWIGRRLVEAERAA